MLSIYHGPKVTTLNNFLAMQFCILCYLISSKYLTISDETNFASHVGVVTSGLIGDELEVLLTTVVDVDHAALGCSGGRISEEGVHKVGVVVSCNVSTVEAA
jgi:hypothetical protein